MRTSASILQPLHPVPFGVSLSHLERGPGPTDSLSLGAGGSFRMACASQQSYEVSLIDGLLLPSTSALADAIGERKAILVTTPNVDRLYGAAMRALLEKTNTLATVVLPAREDTKSLELVKTVCREALFHGLNRRGLLIGFGGGVCLDVVTLSASLIRRGIGHVRIPTTLIGQIDAGVGLKGAVNFAGKKSFVGCFHPPHGVLVDPIFLRTLPRRFLSSGIAEAVKMGIARDVQLFEALERWAPQLVTSAFAAPEAEGRDVLRRSIWAMLDELRKNPREDRGYERIVDFGHTFSPALEAALGFDIHHGEAVAVDIALSTAIAFFLEMIDRTVLERILLALRSAGLPVFSDRLDLALCLEALKEARRHRGGRINLVVPTGIGRTAFLRRSRDIPKSVLAESLTLLSSSALAAS